MNKKTIEFNKSSILSLKAELLRKKEEIAKSKLENQIKSSNLLKPKTLKTKEFKEETKSVDVEDYKELERSRNILESKALLYEKLSKNNSVQNIDSPYLVEFDKKKEDSYSDEDDDNEWIDYVDCLGRTRTCLKKDLENVKKRDLQLEKSLPPEKVANPSLFKEKEDDEEVSASKNETTDLFNNEKYLNEIREKWEAKEKELLNKTNIHYQDLLFDEQRQHGVGYFSFSENENVRMKQQEELKKLREDTLAKQKVIIQQKLEREKKLAERKLAAMNRKRATQGLPPLEQLPEVKKDTEENDDNKPIEINIPDNDQLEQEKIAEQARLAHVRPWDVGKSVDLENIPKRDDVLSQKEWIEKKRNERIQDFAPPTKYDEKSKFGNLSTGQVINNNKMIKKLEWMKKKQKSKNKSIWGESSQIKITNVESIEKSNEDLKIEELNYNIESETNILSKRFKNNYCEIPPPIHLNEETKVKISNSNDLKSSIEAGLKFIRAQVEQKQHANTEHVGFFE